VPDNSASSADPHDLSGKIAKIQETLDGRYEELAADVKVLRHHVVEGNGKPGLLQRVAELEVHRMHDAKAVETIDLSIRNIGIKLDLEATRREAEIARQRAREAEVFEAQRKRDFQNRKDRIGWLIGAGGILAGLVQGLLSFFHR
jgi:hypothetical protein